MKKKILCIFTALCMVLCFTGCLDEFLDNSSSSSSSSSSSKSDSSKKLSYSEAAAPRSAKKCKNKNYKDIVEEFKEAGFTNIETKSLEDMIIGLLVSEDEIKTISIDDKDDFDEGDVFKKNAKIVISYHSYPAKDSEKDSESEKETEKETTTTKEETMTTTTTTTKATTTKAASSEYEYCFVKRGPQYSMYYLIDTEKKKGIYFATNDSSVMEGNCIGDMSNGFTITYTFEGGWSERLVPAGGGKIKMYDAYGQDWDYEITAVEEGERELVKIKQM